MWTVGEVARPAGVSAFPFVTPTDRAARAGRPRGRWAPAPRSAELERLAQVLLLREPAKGEDMAARDRFRGLDHGRHDQETRQHRGDAAVCAAACSGLGRRYLDDPRFAATDDAVVTGLAADLRDATAVHARKRLV